MIDNSSRYRQSPRYPSRDPSRDDSPILAPAAYEPVAAPIRRLHRVVAGERLDHLATRYYGDPLKFHLICDANGAVFPEDLEIPGKVLEIPLDPR